MRIGLDFDNTIVSYDSLFHKVAVEKGHVAPEVGKSKLAVRDHLRARGREAVWIEMQGYVYGARMMEAEAFPGAIDFLCHARGGVIEASIVSHKTLYPFAGPSYDLHKAARGWIAAHLVKDDMPLLPLERVFFELTKDKKLARIATSGFDIFVDDLPEILTHPAFPQRTLPVLFDPTGQELLPPRVLRVTSWKALHELVANSACQAN
jgi:hypothetical protein